MPSLNDLLQRMTARGWKPGIPASEPQVRAVEKSAGVSLPADYREFLLYCGGGEKNAVEAWRGLWRVGDLMTWHKRFERVFPGLFAIGNEAFMVYAFDLRDDRKVPVVSFGLTSSSWDDVLVEAGSFVEWLDDHVPKK